MVPDFVGSHDEQVHTIMKMRERLPEMLPHQGNGVNRRTRRKQFVEPSLGIRRHPIPQFAGRISLSPAALELAQPA